MNRIVMACLLAGWTSLLVLSGCGDKEDPVPSIVGTWGETERMVTNYDAQNQAQFSYVLTSTAGQFLTLRADGTYEYIRILFGTLNGSYTYSGGTLTTPRVVPNAATLTFSSKVLEVSTTKLRLEEEVNDTDPTGNSIRRRVETRYLRK